MFATLPPPQLCLSRLQMVSVLRREALWESWCSAFQPLCPLISRCRKGTAGCEHVGIALWCELRHNVNNSWLTVFIIISVAKCGLKLGHLYISVDCCTQPRPTYCVFTLFGCTALLRFSIHLSLSADERQEKHLLPVEVVTYRRHTEREKEK